MTESEIIDDYIARHIDPESDYLHRLYRATNIHLLYGRMASGHIQGRLLTMLTRMIRPKLVLELGTYSGYSGLCIAEGLDEGAMLHTFEINDEQEDFTRPWFDNSGLADRISFHIGDALTEVEKLKLTFDMVFIDADKRKYPEYYQLAMGCTRKGGYIIADNTLWDGHVVEKDALNDPQTRGIMEFNDIVARDDRVEKVILPMRDGLSIIRIK